ncbi:MULTISPECIES: GNAT family N-acetyltransferase [Providencia]|uniref:GNAT family protein n=1 Tax=Providencia huashanensis TaxID=3037798 RepID=A0AA42FIS5_9GAMM|nr:MULTISPECIES: GNAT family protein [Providencia]HCI95826.1 N-acetyltransferase [Providencia sp.]APC13348.1 Putative ribosomal N-acetyltransferase YdaF [Providencia rettgeri]AVL72719.1 N-acetyltransferase [Providencia rettgeri]EIL1981357.1 GNAT family N-acetyltransferase [Providencia rettgeri]EIU7555711.1 GNAT family N-acetyltransferase [Providencia rettgeri]
MKEICQTITLEGSHVRLEFLSHQYDQALSAMIQKDGLHKLWYTSVPEPENVAKDVDNRLKRFQQKEMLPFVVIDKKTGNAVGMTSYLRIDSVVRRVEIGATWYGKEVQRTAINTEAKYLLLQYAFEQLNCVAVELRTHFLNQQSRRAIERLGAKLDGVLRNHMLTRTGELRDSCIYSIIESEWPAIKRHLEWQMVKPR